MQRKKSDSSFYQHQPVLGGLVPRTILKARRKMFRSLMQTVRPTSKTSILDVGVTSDRRPDSNFFEKWYDYPENITAVGLEDASFLEEMFPGLKFVQADGANLPFPDKSFDLVLSFAVLEHVGNRKQQQAFVHELCRVGRICYITTPNRWYPVEFHTVLPLIHWLPPNLHRRILQWLGKSFWAKEAHLNLLSHREMLELLPGGVRVETHHNKLFGLTSNLVYLIESI